MKCLQCSNPIHPLAAEKLLSGYDDIVEVQLVCKCGATYSHFIEPDNWTFDEHLTQTTLEDRNLRSVL